MEEKIQVCLYIFTHNKTGLKYFGKTINAFTEKELLKYGGSGTYWNNHLKTHGKDISVEIYGIYKINEVKSIALKFSEENNIVEALNESGERKGKKVWANLEPEDGLSGFSKRTIGKCCVFNKIKQKYEQINTKNYNEEIHNYTTKGQVTVLEDEHYKNISKEEYLTGNYKMHSTGFVNCIDITTGLSKKVSKEEFDNNSNLQNVMKGKIPCWDTRTNTKINLTEEELNSQDYYISNTEKVGPVAYFNIKTKEIGTCSKNEFNNNKNLISKITKNKYLIFNGKNELMEEIFRFNFGKYDEWLYKGLLRALKEESIYANSITNIKNKKYKFKGWKMKKIKIKDEFWNKK